MIELNNKMKSKLNEIIPKDENMIYAINAVSSKYKNTISFGKTLYAILTNKRLIILDKGIFNIEQTTINLDKIDSIYKKDRILNSDVYIYTNSTQALLANVEKKEADIFINYVNEELENYKSFSIQINKNTEKDITDKIEKIAELHKDGILTDYEFSTKKMELLEKLKK